MINQEPPFKKGDLNIIHVKDNDLINIIDTKVYMSPPEYLLARNISIIFSSLNFCKNKLEEWYKIVNKQDKYRVAVIHNNLNLSHFIKNNNDYLINVIVTKNITQMGEGSFAACSNIQTLTIPFASISKVTSI